MFGPTINKKTLHQSAILTDHHVRVAHLRTPVERIGTATAKAMVLRYSWLFVRPQV